MVSENFHNDIVRSARMIQSARYVVAFTGAGISTPSGIPDFRSPGTGLWSTHDPMKVASLTAFKYHPEFFFDWLRPLAEKSIHAVPNAAHLCLAKLEEACLLKAVITQNIDQLHQKGGSKRVFELHGSLGTLTCINCRQQQALENVFDLFVTQRKTPHCPVCGAILKPDIVLYEEMLPEQVWHSAEDEIRKADLLLVIGSSLEVYPAASLPLMAFQRGCALVLNTLSETPFDNLAECLLHRDTAEVLPMILQEMNL